MYYVAFPYISTLQSFSIQHSLQKISTLSSKFCLSHFLRKKALIFMKPVNIKETKLENWPEKGLQRGDSQHCSSHGNQAPAKGFRHGVLRKSKKKKIFLHTRSDMHIEVQRSWPARGKGERWECDESKGWGATGRWGLFGVVWCWLSSSLLALFLGSIPLLLLLMLLPFSPLLFTNNLEPWTHEQTTPTMKELSLLQTTNFMINFV